MAAELDARTVTRATIRAAVPTDAAAIAALHVMVSGIAYATLAPESARQRLNLEHRRARWQETLDAPGRRLVLVAESGDRLVAVGSCGAPSVPELGPRAEILHLYVDPAFAGRGLGRRLMRDLARHARAEGYPGVALGVVEGNDGAIAFYERLGGRCIGRYTDPGPIWRSQNLAYAWDDLTPLIG